MKIPKVYLDGVRFLEKLDTTATEIWLRDELFDKQHCLAGRWDDFPVQAILNHCHYVSPSTLRRIRGVIRVLFFSWKQKPEDWNEHAFYALLHLVSDLKVVSLKLPMQLFAESGYFATLQITIRAAVLQAVAGLSTKSDRHFWKRVAKIQPEFAGLAFQVLTRVWHPGAVEILRILPEDSSVVGSVILGLPILLSKLSFKETQLMKTNAILLRDTRGNHPSLTRLSDMILAGIVCG